MRPRFIIVVIGLVTAIGVLDRDARLAHAARQNSTATRAALADSLHQRGIERMARGTFESRRAGLGDLEEATRLAPDRASFWCDRASASFSLGQIRSARESWAHAEGLAPEDVTIQTDLGQAWKRDWLSTSDTASFTRASRHLFAASHLDPRNAAPRAALAALALVPGDLDLAARAARSAIGADPTSLAARLAFAMASYRTGAFAVAESSFAAVLADLPPEQRRHFTDATMVGGVAPRDSEGAAGEAAANAFWRGSDPDLTTPENEVQLDYMSRVAQAFLLFGDGAGPRWDARTEMFVRYGLPERIEFNPNRVKTEYRYTRYRKAPVDYLPDPLGYPYNVQVWSYPTLGMRFELWNQALDQTYQFPIVTDHDSDPKPDPLRLAGRDDLVAFGDGRSLFHMLPPGVRRMKARGQVSRFPSETGTRLVAQIEAPGGARDSLWGTWAVVGSDGRERARESGPLALSQCDPAERRFANFSAAVPPGEYRVDLSVEDRRGRRGVVRLRSLVQSGTASLALSDLVLLCGAGAPAASDRIEIEPNLDRNVAGARSISAYFEIDRLTTAADGGSRFTYVYRVRRIVDQGRGEKLSDAVVDATRTEENVGPRRRQYLTVPLPKLEAGPYRLEVEVKDDLSGQVAVESVRFTAE